MKLHLPFALLAAVVSAVAYAEEVTHDIHHVMDTSKNVTVTIGEGDYTNYNMYKNSKPGYIGCAAHEVDGKLNVLTTGSTKMVYNSIDVTVGDTDGNKANDPIIKYLVMEGCPVNSVSGNKKLTVNSGEIEIIYGGIIFEKSNTSANLEHVGNYIVSSHPYPYKDSKNPADLNITINDGTIGQIRAGHSGKQESYVYDMCKSAYEGTLKNENGEKITYEALMKNKPWAISGNVNVTLNGGLIQAAKAGKTTAIMGAGGSGHSVDGTVTVTVNKGATVEGDIFAGPNNIYAEVGKTVIEINGGTIIGNVYGGGDIDDGISKFGDKFPKAPAPTVLNGTNITITGGTIEGSVYGAGIGDIVKGGTCITLLGGTITGGVYGGGTDDSSVVEGEKILYVGNADQEFTGSVGWVEGFTQVIVSKGSSLKMDAGNVFEVNEQIITLSSANLMEAAMSGGFALVGEKGLSLTLLAGETLASGKYKVVELTENGNGKLRATAPAGPQGWEEGKVTFTSDSIAGFDDLVWEGNILYLIYKQWNVDAAIVSNWGVFKSSQAFTGTLWGNRSNAVVLGSPAGTYDGKAPVAIADQPSTTLAWASAYGQSGRISNAGADYSLYGAAMGIERQFGAKGSSIGVAFGYDWGKVSPFTTTSADQETWHAALYGRAGAWKAGKGIVSVDWSVAYGDTTTEHNEYTSDWSQDSWQFDVRATYAQALSERATASVFAGVQYYTHDDATVDNMHISSLQNLRLTAGAGLNYAATARTNVYGQASLYFDAMRHNPHVDTNGASFQGTNPGRIGGVLSLGADYAISEQWTLRGGYSFDAAKDSTEHNVNAGVQYSF